MRVLIVPFALPSWRKRNKTMATKHDFLKLHQHRMYFNAHLRSDRRMSQAFAHPGTFRQDIPESSSAEMRRQSPEFTRTTTPRRPSTPPTMPPAEAPRRGFDKLPLCSERAPPASSPRARRANGSLLPRGGVGLRSVEACGDCDINRPTELCKVHVLPSQVRPGKRLARRRRPQEHEQCAT